VPRVIFGRSVALDVENPENGTRLSQEPDHPGAKCLAPSTAAEIEGRPFEC
jgi:hypothetical protein